MKLVNLKKNLSELKGFGRKSLPRVKQEVSNWRNYVIVILLSMIILIKPSPLQWYNTCKPIIKIEYKISKPPASRLVLHPLPVLEDGERGVTNDSLVKAYKASIKEIKLCNVDKNALR